MPRNKSVPQHLGTATQKRLSWNLLENPPSNGGEVSTEDNLEEQTPKKRFRKEQDKCPSPYEEVNQLLSHCNFYLTIKNSPSIKPTSWVCNLGTIELSYNVEDELQSYFTTGEYWIYVSEEDQKSFLYFEDRDDKEILNVKYCMLSHLPPYKILEALKVKNFILCHKMLTENKLKIDVLLRTTGISKLSYPSEVVKLRPCVDMQTVMKYFYGVSLLDYGEKRRNRHHDINALYEAVKSYRRPKDTSRDKMDVQHPSLIPILRPYQADAVRWMLEQEKVSTYHGEEVINSKENIEMLHELFIQLESVNKIKMYYNKYGGYIVLEKPLKIPRRPGGILADEMGLGKTVEVLTCVLCHPRPPLSNIIECKDEREKLNGETSHMDVNFTNSDSENKKKLNPNQDDASIEMNIVEQSPVIDELIDHDYAVQHSKTEEIISSENMTDSVEIKSDEEMVSQNLEETSPKYTRNEAAKLNDSLSIKIPLKSYFECICGAFESELDFKDRVQCETCGLWQHLECVKYEPSLGEYNCPHCWVAKVPVPSGATLIVSPSSIKDQWVEEIHQHLRHKALRILVYNGIHREGFIQPKTLADHDLVLTSYETLRKELDYVDLPHSNSDQGRRFRHPKRFMAVPSPLVAVEWWRICLDEAQMVECTTSKTAEMALRLSAINRWCVTGTPIQKSIEDLQGLLLFLGADPYWVKRWWNECLYEPYCFGEIEPLHKVISQYLWRTSKKDVIEQIDLPEQNEEIHWLSFTPVEEHFYRQQHSECSRDAVKQFNKISDLNIKLKSLDRKFLGQLLAPLLRLRQACCHPQAVRGQFMSVHKSTLTMEELLTSLIKKTKLEAEEAHRLHISSINGLAALHLIKEEWIEASEKYREVLLLADEHGDQIKTDKLQRLHALHNLAELLDAGHANIPPTIRDSSLRQEAEQLKSAYLIKCASKISSSQEALTASQQAVAEIRSRFVSHDPWWSIALNTAVSLDKQSDLIERIQNDLAVMSTQRVSLANRFRDINGLKLIIVNQLDDLQQAHSKLEKAVVALKAWPSEAEINAAVECHLRSTEKKPIKCLYCRVHDLFNKYEARLFSFNADGDSKLHLEPSTSEEALMGQLRRGTWADSDLERIFKIIFSFSKTLTNNQIIIDDGNTHLKLFEALKKEFRSLRSVWMQIRDQVSALDELNMATTRLRLRLPDEPKADASQLNILEPSEIDRHQLKLLSDRIVAINEKRKKLGQLLYLQNLAKSDYSKRGGSNPELCPICQRALGEQWSVLQCGHCFCVACIRSLVTHCSRSRLCSVKCPVCRQVTGPGEISYVNTKNEEAEELQEIEVKGSYSTKVEAIVRCLLQIKLKDPDAKVLVFSTWQNVLDVIAKALADNELTFRTLTSNAKYKNFLAAFKRNPELMCLLLPVHSGANGLNLIEATHVLLVEPILNPASELQAIGRVHRIGQTKPTIVHRFLIRETIEERMHSLLKSHSFDSSCPLNEDNAMTVAELKSLFVDEAEPEICDDS